MKRRQTRETQKPDSAWKLMRLGDVFEQRTQRGSAGLPVLSVTMDKGLVARDSVEKKMKQSLPPEESLLVQPGDIVYNTMRMWQGAVAYSDREGVVSPAYVVCRPNTALIDGQFMHCLFKSREGQNKLQAFSHGLTEDRLRLYFDDFAEIPFRLPSLSEQKRISKILGTWDDALQALEGVIRAKVRYKDSLVQRLLMVRNSRAVASAGVQFIKASEMFAARAERNTAGAPILSVTQDQGAVFRDLLERRIVYDENTASGYKLVRPGDYIISLRSFEGGLEYSAVEGAVSPAYHVIYPIKEIDREFYRHYFKSEDFISRLSVAVIGIRDGKQISFSDFAFLKLPYPDLQKQGKIGRLLSATDAELRVLRQKHAALVTQKQGLMQLLLTGKKRVRV